MHKGEHKDQYFSDLYKTYYEKVLRICGGYVSGDMEMAKDLTQETFVKIWQNLSGFKGNAKVSTWIFRIAINTCLLHQRKAKKIKNSHFDFTSEDDLDQQLMETRMKKMLDSINQLSPQNKSIILLELEAVPQKEIAAIMGMSHSAVRVRISRIKQTLAKKVKQ